MSNRKRSARGRSRGCLSTLLAILLLYYGVQVWMRTPALSAFERIAHRGARAYAPENTLRAFRTAIAQGLDWLEFDVQMTKDGALVVIHDETVDRTTDGSGAVRDLTLEQIRAFDAGEGEQVPTFEEVIELAKASGAHIMPETKSAHLYPGLEEKMLQSLEQADYLDQTVIQSFEPDSLNTLHRLNPKANLCALYGLWQFNVSSPAGDAQYICPMAEMVLLYPGILRQAHRDGRHVFPWFGALEKPAVVNIMRFFGADGLIMDDPLATKGG
jgi:glycerophosphoryl diester phosphodiesterase